MIILWPVLAWMSIRNLHKTVHSSTLPEPSNDEPSTLFWLEGMKEEKVVESKSKLIEEVGERAYEYEKDYHGCAQSALKALQEHLNIGDDLTFKAASALAGGGGRMGGVCGALLGGMMAISLAFGREKMEPSEDSAGYETAHNFAGELGDKFREAFGGITCREVQKSFFGRSFDLRNPDERKLFHSLGAYEKCPEVVRAAARLAAEIITRERAKSK